MNNSNNPTETNKLEEINWESQLDRCKKVCYGQLSNKFGVIFIGHKFFYLRYLFKMV